jgi:membrane-bound serine protease (ClpP class)
MRSNFRRNARRGLAATLLAMSWAVISGAHAGADVVDPAGIDVVQIDGLIDPPNASLLRDAIEDAEARESTLLVVQLDSGGAVDVNLGDLRNRISNATVPIVVWIGPAGATARGAAAYLATAAPYLSMATNAKIGPCEHYTLDPHTNMTAMQCLPAKRLNAKDAEAAGVADRIDASLRNLLTELDGVTIAIPAGGEVKLSTKIVVPAVGDGDPTTSINQDLRFNKLTIGGQVLHTLNAPWVAYFLFVAGVALIVFELYAASIGAAAIVGAIALVCAGTGFSHLPVTWWGLGLLSVGLLGLTIDLQAGGVGFWSGFGVLAMIAGSRFLFDGSPRLDPPWWTIALVIVGTVAFFVGGLPAMLRTRFSTPTIGREGIIGEMGTAEVDVHPDGVVRVRDALWKAHANRATPIKAGDAVRVVAVDGLVLEIEPESGGAEDYRERARKRKP